MTKRRVLILLLLLASLAACDTSGEPTATPIPAFTNPATPQAATTTQPGDSVGGTTYPLPIEPTVVPQQQPGTYPTMDPARVEAYPTP